MSFYCFKKKVHQPLQAASFSAPAVPTCSWRLLNPDAPDLCQEHPGKTAIWFHSINTAR